MALAGALAPAILVSCKKREDAPPVDSSPPAPGNYGGSGVPDSGSASVDGEVPSNATILAQGFPTPQGIAVGASYVYFTLNGTFSDDGGLAPRTGSVMRVPRAGGTPNEIASAQDDPYAITTYANATTSGIAWTNRGTLQDTGGVYVLPSNDAVKSLTDGEEATGIRSDGLYAYWTSTLGDGNILVERESVGGGGPDTLGSVPIEGFPEAVAIDASYIYFVASGAGAGVYRVPIAAGGSVENIASLPDASLTDIVVLSGTIYFCDAAAGKVYAMPASGGAVTTIASGQSQPTRLAVSATTLYWTNHVSGGAVWAAPLGADAAAPHAIATKLDRPYAIAIADAVYFTTWDAVLKISP